MLQVFDKNGNLKGVGEQGPPGASVWGSITGTITDQTDLVTYVGSQGFITASSTDTLTNKTWEGAPIGAIYGGTGLTTYATGDTLYASASNVISRLHAGSNGQVLTLAGGIPSWATPTTGTVTSVSGTANQIGSTGGATPVISLISGGILPGAWALGTPASLTLTNATGLPNAGLLNSTISGISLGSNLATLTIGTGLSGTSYNGSTGITIAIDSSVVILTGSQALSNKTGLISQWTNDSSYISLSSTLSGLSVTGSTIASGSTVIGAFGALQNQINGILGGAIYQGVWNATTNSPTLVSSTGTKGYYYVVSVAGATNLDGITDWAVGDWAIFNGTAWQKVDNTDAVSSVNGAIGAVVVTTTGTTNRVTVSGGSGLTPTIDISASYVGQSSITTLGTITTGVWNGTAIANANLANSSLTIGSTSISLGATSTTLAGLTSVTSTTFVGALTGNASTATALATGRTISISGDLTYTSSSFDGSGNVTAAGTLATVNSNVGSFGSATQVGTFTVNAKGLITAASNVTITGFASSTLTNTHIFVGNGSNVATDVALSGDATLANTGAITLATVNSNVGSFGSATQTATFTVNAKGLTTAAANVTITPAVGSITGLGTSVATALGVNVGSAGAFVTFNGALGTPSSGTLTNCTFPTLNQNTTGSAASLSISGQTALLTFTGLASTNRIKTIRDAADTILELGGSYTPTGTWTSLTMVTPVLGTPTSGTVTNLTGTASININGTVGATTPTTGAFTTVNGNTFTTGTYTLTGTAAKTLNFTNTLTLTGTDGTTMTFPATSATLARTDAANTFSGVQTMTGATILNATTSVYRNTNGGSNVSNVQFFLDWSGSASVAGAQGMGVSSTNLALEFTAANGTRRISRAAIGITNLVNTANSESADFFISTQAAGAAYTEKLRVSSTGDLTVTGGGLLFATVGKGITYKSGTNTRGGNATLVAGTITVSNNTVTANTLVTLTRKTSGGTIGTAITYTLNAGTSFTINSDNPLDTSTFTYTLSETN